MTLASVTTASLRKDFGVDVNEVTLIIAKNSVLGMDDATIIEIVGLSQTELEEIRAEEIYKQTRAFLGMEYAKGVAQQSASWDEVEGIALKRLIDKMPHNNDPDFILRAAAVANKAIRKHGKTDNVLDAATRGGRTVITLTERLTRRLTGPVSEEIEREREFSISQGRGANPSFEEVDELLKVSASSGLTRAIQPKVVTHTPSIDELTNHMLGKFDGV